MKQTLKVGQKYRVIQDDSYNPIEPGTIITVKKLISLERFYDENDNEWWFDPEYLELVKPKTKKVKKYKYSRKEIDAMLMNIDGYKINWEIRPKLLATQPQPIKEESKDIEKLELFFNEDEDCYEINEMRHSDSRIDLLAGKLNEVINTLNSLTKRK